MSRFSNTAQIYTAQKTVAVSGTPERLTSSPIPDGASLVIKAKAANSGTITVGSSSANALNSGSSCFKLAAGQSISFQVQNADAVWIDATVSGEGVELACEF